MWQRNIHFAALLALTLLVFFLPVRSLVRLSLQSELYSHILVVPVLSMYLFYRRRNKIFERVEYRFGLGGSLLAAGAGLFYMANRQSGVLSINDSLSLTILAFVTLALGEFLCLYGVRAFREALFPLLFLFFLVPLPDFLAAGMIWLLQRGSAEAAGWFFNLTDIPVFREGLRFSLPGLTIEVAEVCSGIRSGLALLITSLVAGHLSLQSVRSKVLLCLSVFPIAVLKNGLRIFVLSSLGVYVDRSFLTGWLHAQGGIPFFLLALMIVFGILRILRRFENKSGRKRGPNTEIAETSFLVRKVAGKGQSV